MCSYKLLVHNKHGYIIKCNGCTHYQIAFGTTLFSLGVDDFKSFSNQISELKLITVPNGFPEQKRIRVQLPFSDTMMVLSLNELEQLFVLVEEGSISEELNQILTKNKLAFSFEDERK